MLGGKSRHQSSTSFSRYLFSPLNTCFRKGKTHLQSLGASSRRGHNLIPSPAPAHPLDEQRSRGLGWLADFFPSPPLALAFFTFPIPHGSVLASRRLLILRNVSGLGLEKLKLINCLFEGVESDKREGMPGLTDPKPPRCSAGLKDERVIPSSWGRVPGSGDLCCHWVGLLRS